MSYDAYMMIDTGARDETGAPCLTEVSYCGNMTSNVSGMWRKALGFSLGDMHGWAATECIPRLERALVNMEDPVTMHEYRRMEPENGWGTFEGAKKFLTDILAKCKEHPKATLRISR